MTVSPAMWVTGNMASNMSLTEKETERRGRREKERGRENTVITNIPAIIAHYATVLLNYLLPHTHTNMQSVHKSLLCGRAAWWKRQSQLNRVRFQYQFHRQVPLPKGQAPDILDDPNTHTQTRTKYTHLNVYTTDFFIIINIQTNTHYPQ